LAKPPEPLELADDEDDEDDEVPPVPPDELPPLLVVLGLSTSEPHA
jgi:hypothetical protein